MKKPGYKTTEFWFTLVSFVFSGLYLMGIIGDISQKEDLIRDVSHGVESVILIGGQLMILYRYIGSRVALKQEEMETVRQEPQPETIPNTTPTKTTKKTKKDKPSTSKKGPTNARNKRTNTSRSRKTDKPSKDSPK